MCRGRHVFAPIAIAASLSGCILDTEQCGPDFVLRDNRCVPQIEPLPFRPEADAFPVPEVGPQFDATLRTDSGAKPGIDAGGPLDARFRPDAAAPPNPWAPFVNILLVDLTAVRDARATPQTPGADLDAVRVVGPDQRGFGGELIEFIINDPFDQNRATDPSQALGPPDWRDGRVDGIVSLGTDGGFIYMSLEMSRPLARGDVIEISEAESSGGRTADRLQAWLCLDGHPDPDNCRELGEGQGTFEIELP